MTQLTQGKKSTYSYHMGEQRNKIRYAWIMDNWEELVKKNQSNN